MRMKKILFFFLLFIFLFVPAQAEAKVTSKKAIYTEITENFMAHKKNFSIECPYNSVVDTLLARINSPDEAKFYRGLYEITALTDKPNSTDDGDYLYANLQDAYCYYTDGRLRFYNVVYSETKAQTAKVNKKVAKIARKLKKKAKSKAKRVELAYEYVIKHVKYDYRKKCNYSAYKGLYKGKTVCNGYAMILYKLLNKMEIPCKFVSGTLKEGKKKYLHAWNIVKLKGKWYNLDACADDSDNSVIYKHYFLKGDKAFSKDHKRDAFYRTKAFKKKYKMSTKNHSFSK